MPGTGRAPGGMADVLWDDGPSAGAGVEPQAAVSSTASVMAVRRMAGSVELPGGSAAVLSQPRHHPAGLHPHLELRLPVGRRTAARLTVVEVERGAVQRAHQAVRAPDPLNGPLVQGTGQVRAGGDEDVDPPATADRGQGDGDVVARAGAQRGPALGEVVERPEVE